MVKAPATPPNSAGATLSNLRTFLAAVCGRDLTKVKQMMDAGTDPNGTINSSKAAPLHYAAERGYRDVAELLLQGGADINQKTTEGETPLSFATCYKHKDLIKYFIEQRAVLTGLELSWACYNGTLEIAKYLLTHGAPVNYQSTTYGTTPLMEAVTQKHIEIIKLLLSYKADPTIKDRSGANALALALETKNPTIEKIVREAWMAMSTKSTTTGASGEGRARAASVRAASVAASEIGGPTAAAASATSGITRSQSTPRASVNSSVAPSTTTQSAKSSATQATTRSQNSSVAGQKRVHSPEREASPEPAKRLHLDSFVTSTRTTTHSAAAVAAAARLPQPPSLANFTVQMLVNVLHKDFFLRDPEAAVTHLFSERIAIPHLVTALFLPATVLQGLALPKDLLLALLALQTYLQFKYPAILTSGNIWKDWGGVLVEDELFRPHEPSPSHNDRADSQSSVEY